MPVASGVDVVVHVEVRGEENIPMRIFYFLDGAIVDLDVLVLAVHADANFVQFHQHSGQYLKLSICIGVNQSIFIVNMFKSQVIIQGFTSRVSTKIDHHNVWSVKHKQNVHLVYLCSHMSNGFLFLQQRIDLGLSSNNTTK